MNEGNLTEQLPVLVTKEEKILIEKCAKAENRSVSNFCRLAVIDKVRMFKSADELDKKQLEEDE